jgi:hypothetical protein
VSPQTGDLIVAQLVPFLTDLGGLDDEHLKDCRVASLCVSRGGAEGGEHAVTAALILQPVRRPASDQNAPFCSGNIVICFLRRAKGAGYHRGLGWFGHNPRIAFRSAQCFLVKALKGRGAGLLGEQW